VHVKAGKSKKTKTNAYVGDENRELRKVVKAFGSFLKKCVPRGKETVNAWGIPTFEAPHPFCLYMVGKNHVTFRFHYGASLKNPHDLLEGMGKNIRHVKLCTVEDLQHTGLKNLVLAAASPKDKPPMRAMRGK
jgi:hypothetical protein